jgi:hypothetical protein
MRGQEAQAEAGDHRLLDRLVARDLHRDADRRKRAPNASRIEFQVSEPGSRTQNGSSSTRASGNARGARERMRRRRDDHVRVRRERLGDHVVALGRPHHHREVREVVGEPAQQALRGSAR